MPPPTPKPHIQAYLNQDWRHMVKDRCAGCLKHIRKDEARYKQRGNFCEDCDKLVTNSLLAKTLTI